jgi:hypothetical protein
MCKGSAYITAMLFGLALVEARCLPPPEPDPEPQDGNCDAACATLERLGCPEGAQASDGTPCAELCRAEEMGQQYSLGCIEALTVCDVASCER